MKLAPSSSANLSTSPSTNLSSSAPCAPATRPDEPPTDELLRQLALASLGPLAELQNNLSMTMDEIVEWMAERKNRRSINNLVNLYDAQSQLLLCQQRVLAVARLTQIAADHEAKPEVVRRACADLLKIRLVDPYKEDERPHDRGARNPTLEELNARLLGQPVRPALPLNRFGARQNGTIQPRS